MWEAFIYCEVKEFYRAAMFLIFTDCKKPSRTDSI